eukprot:GGOE01004742.1.p1 GENE.GGOE01004742.1~~GGOE01004742.1.p1  ORF type:complete len:247 (+),score=100.48 GGOE01004742.1:36-743(+)
MTDAPPQPATIREILDHFEQAVFLTGKNYHRSRQWERTDALVAQQERLQDLAFALRHLQAEEAEERGVHHAEEHRRFERVEWAEQQALAEWFERQHRARRSTAGVVVEEQQARDLLETDYNLDWDQLVVFEAYEAKEVQGARPRPCPPEVCWAMERQDRVRTEALLRQGIEMEEQETWNNISCSQCLELTHLEYRWALEEDCCDDWHGLQVEENAVWRSLVMGHCEAYMALTSPC